MSIGKLETASILFVLGAILAKTSGTMEYCLIRADLNFQQSQDTCAALGMKMAELKTQREFDSASELASRTFIRDTDVWIGLKEDSAEKSWFWLDRTPIDFSKWCCPWKPANAHCARLDFSHNFKWAPASCATKLSVLCQRENGGFEDNVGFFKRINPGFNFSDVPHQTVSAASRNSCVMFCMMEKSCWYLSYRQGACHLFQQPLTLELQPPDGNEIWIRS